MAESEMIGELRETACKVEVEWKIADFLSLPGEIDTVYYSPDFFFSDLGLNMQICPYGESPKDASGYLREGSKGWIGLWLAFEDNDMDPSKTFSYTFCIKQKDGKLVNIKKSKHKIANNEMYGSYRFFERSELLKKKSELISLGALTITCTLAFSELHSKKDSRLARLLSVSHNFKDILKSEKRADVVLKLKGCEILAHRLILESRSAVFAKMFAHDMEENRTGVVKMDDVDENVLRCILSFIYSGEVEEMSSKIVRGIYVAADKYDLQELKELCMNFMQENLSIDLVCDVLAIADIYKDTELKEISKRYFAENSKEIIKTDKWKALKGENPVLAWAIIENAIEVSRIDTKN